MDELIDRLEKADRGQTSLKFHITVPPRISTVQEPPTTPKRRRFEREDSEEEDDPNPSQKEARVGEPVEDEGGGSTTSGATIGGPDDPSKGEEGGGVHGNEDGNTIKEDGEINEDIPTEGIRDEHIGSQIGISSSSSVIQVEDEGGGSTGIIT